MFHIAGKNFYKQESLIYKKDFNATLKNFIEQNQNINPFPYEFIRRET